MKTGILFLHGFTGGPFEVRPFVTYITEHTNWEVAVPTLAGHGKMPELERASAQAWLMDAEVAFRKLQKETDRVIVVGFSMGGLIAMYLALRYPVEKLVLLSAAAKYISPKILLEEAVVMLKESVTKQYQPNSFNHLYKYKLANTPIQAAIEFLRVVKMVEPYYDLIDVPVCIVQGKKDGIVPFATAQYLLETIGSEKKEFIKSDLGKHHICYSDDCGEWFPKVLRFMGE